jgi:hypothetical protein
MANKILADLGLSPFSKFLVVYWLSLGLIVLDQIGILSDITTTLAELGSVVAAIEVIAAVLILYGAYLLYNKQKRGALIAIATNMVVVAYFVFIVGQTPVSLGWVVVYVVAYIVVVAGPVLLFPNEYS